MEFLSYCPSVEELVVSFARVWFSELNLQLYRTLIFRQLTTLKFISAHNEYVEPALNSHVALLDSLRVPKLKSLLLSIGPTTDASQGMSLWSAISRLIGRYEAQLENLAVWNYIRTPNEFVGLLRKVHGLRYLGIEYSLCHKDIIDTIFLPTNGSELLWPHLEAFSILDSGDLSEKQDFDVPFHVSAARSRVDTIDDRPRHQFKLVVCEKLCSSVAKCQPVVGVEVVPRVDWIEKQRGDLFRCSGQVWKHL
ncbi:hypothetical protein BD410DRAFT_902172 [Rickenella mellea]|uniref:F-box domain-containing protein n=1 Tax=Rickenella mellea TaxID=50990 RepID=A0A4Y7PNY2_9AGAM|nr:hypothetical protein BD410DRAFT_902172 [Rickenella mellea]